MKKKYLLLAAVMVLLIILCCGCAAEEPEETTVPVQTQETVATEPEETLPPRNPEWAPKEEYDQNESGYVRFSRDSGTTLEVYVSRDYILNYESAYADCNGTWFRDQLSEEDRCIYNSYLYAMENQCTWFDLYVEDNDKDFRFVREAVSLGSPFLEQNTNRLGIGEGFYKNPRNYMGESISLYLPQFSEDRWSLKMEALEKCREIVANIPAEYTTQEQKMEYLYRYVCDNVEYVMYENMEDEDHLYDAVCRGEAVCDGYSNMLNLLFCLIGVESYEAMGSNYEDLTQLTPEELAQAMGHTWVVARIGDSFYNFDPTYEDTKEDPMWGDLQFFGFSDDLLSIKYLDCEDFRPQCTDTSRDGRFADITVEDRENNAQILAVSQLLDARMEEGESVTTVLIRDLTTEKQIHGFMYRCIGKTQKLKRTVSLRIAYLRDAALVEVTAEHR